MFISHRDKKESTMTYPDLQPKMNRIFITTLLFCKLYLAQTEILQQTGPITRAHVGRSVTLQCFFSQEHKQKRFYWFKQILGNKPTIVVHSQAHGHTVFSQGFIKTQVELAKGDTHFHLIFANVNHSDEGMYFCGMRVSYEIVFGNGTFLAVEGDQGGTVVQAPVSGPVYSGDSVILQCTVLTENPTEEFRVLWFRRSSGGSHPGLIYSPTNRSSGCEDHCVYSLAKSNLSISDSGVYYCVLDRSGQLIFGSGTILEVRSLALLHPVVISLGSVLVLCICSVIYLVWLNCNGRECKHCKGRAGLASEQEDSPANQTQGADTTQVSYAALHLSERKPRAQRKRETLTHDSVYSDVQCHKQEAF